MTNKTINLLFMLLLMTGVTNANTVDFDKVFKESARIEKQIKRRTTADLWYCNLPILIRNKVWHGTVWHHR